MKSERERQMQYDITYMWNLKYGLWNRNRLPDIENGAAVAQGQGAWGRDGAGAWDWRMPRTICKVDKQSPTV